MRFVSDIYNKFRRRKAIQYLQNGQLQKAVYYFEKLIFEADNKTDFYYLVLAKMGLRDFSSAANLLEKILPEYKYNEMILISYLETQQMLRKWENAKKIVDTLRQINPSSKKYQDFERIVHDVILREKKVTAKEKLYEAESLLEKKKYETAHRILVEAENLDASNANIIYNMGYVLLQMKRKKAEFYPYFERATILDPENKKFQKNLDNIKRNYSL